jgi:hypothetical protein
MFVMIVVVTAEFFLSNSGSLRVCLRKIRLTPGLGSHGAQGKQLLDLLSSARRALRRSPGAENKPLELMPAASAFVFKDGHKKLHRALSGQVPGPLNTLSCLTLPPRASLHNS